MIEGCIVAKLVLGYLTDEGFHRTCSAFQEECALFHNGNSKLDQVFLTADLKTILEDYSQLKETGRENGIPSSTAVLKSLWKALDTVIGQLKYATIPSAAPKVNTLGSQATRTRRLNSGRSRRNVLQKTHDISTRTASNPPTMQCSSTPSLPENNVAKKLPLPRLSTVGYPQTLSPSGHAQTLNHQSPCTDQRTLSAVQSTVNKDSNTSQTLSSAGLPVPGSVSSVSCASHVTGIPSSFGPTTAPIVGNSCDIHSMNNTQSSSNDDVAADPMFDLMNDGGLCNDGDFNNTGPEQSTIQATPIIIVDDENNHDQQATTLEEHSMSSSNPNQTELQLRSPKRKCVQPKKRVPQGSQSNVTVAESPVKLVSQSANKEVEMDIVGALDTLTPQSFLGTLLNTPMLQEKLAENINKVVSSSRVPAAGDELSSDSTHSMTTTEASSEDVFMASNQGAGGEIPVKEIMDLMQADPAFDVLFSFFGLDALDALPSATNSSTDLPGTPADSNQATKPTSSLPGSESQIQGCTLGDLSSLPTETICDLGSGITTLRGSNEQLHTPNSVPDVRKENTTLQASIHQPDNPSNPPASDLHLSATSIVTDALLLLAGSPQKKSPPRATAELSLSAGVPLSEQHKPDTPPVETYSTHRSLINDKQPCRQSIVNQPALITSTLPYVRALNFTITNEPPPSKRGRKKGSKNKKSTKQSTMITEQSKTPGNNKGGTNSGRTQVNAKKTSQLTVTSSSQATSCSTVVPRPSNNSQVLNNSGSTFNRAILPCASPSNAVMSSACPSPLPCSFVNCVPSCTPLPDNVVSSSSSPVSHADAVAHSLGLPGNHIVVGTNAGLAPLNVNIPTRPNPSPVNFTTSSSFQTPTVSTPSSFLSCSSPAHLTTLYPSQTPSVGYVVNSTICPTPSSTCPGSEGFNHAPSSSSHNPSNVPELSRTTSAQHVVNAVTTLSSVGLPKAVVPGHFTHSRVLNATTSPGNSISIQSDHRNQAVNSGSDDLSSPAEPLSLEASNLLQTFALKHVNSLSNSSAPQTLAPGSKTGEVGIEGSQNNRPISTENSAISQPLKEKSASLENTSVSEDNTVVMSEKQLAHGSSPANSLEQESRLAGASLQNLQGSENGSTSSLEILNEECSENMKENSTSFPNSQINSEREMQGSTNLQGKRQRDAIQPLKKKKSKSSRPSKRLKTGEQGFNFPSDLNVEEFLSKLHYEDK